MRPVAVMVGIQGHLPAINPDPVQELPAGGSHGPQAGRKLGFGIQFAQLAAEEVADFKNRTDAVLGHLHFFGSVEHAAVFQQRNRPASALTSRSDDCHETPPNGVDIPVSRFAISENFIAVIEFVRPQRIGCSSPFRAIW